VGRQKFFTEKKGRTRGKAKHQESEKIVREFRDVRTGTLHMGHTSRQAREKKKDQRKQMQKSMYKKNLNNSRLEFVDEGKDGAAEEN